MLKPEKCPKCNTTNGILFIEDVLDALVYNKKKCKKWLCRWRCSSCNHKKKSYERWWCGNCNYNFNNKEAGISTMWIKMKSGGCKHFELRDSDVLKNIKNRKNKSKI